MKTVKYKQDTEEGKIEKVGVAVDYLMDNITMLEIQYPANPEQVLAQLKYSLMVQLGRIEPKAQPEPEQGPEGKDQEGGDDDGNDSGTGTTTTDTDNEEPKEQG